MIIESGEDSDEFIVQSENNPEVAYTVYISLRMCTFTAGNGGKFCKHLAAI